MAGRDYPRDRPTPVDLKERLANLTRESLTTNEELQNFDQACRERLETAIPDLLAGTPSDPALGQVERAISETLAHHAQVRLMPAVGRLG